ncbi:MAG TPA: serine/threonine protein kinase [Cyanobacteria bacterium UBA11372]|nr:serine/threonine protein kinase [Cyanobacteria bacterium UBA11372]
MAATADLTIALPGYHLEEQIYSGSRTVVYRGVQEKGEPRRVAIKLLRQEYPTFNDLLQFRNQYAIAKNLDITGIVRPLCLESYRNSYALVMEDFGGVSLWDYTQKQALSVVEVLDLAVQLTEILHALHQNRVIHKDIKPANILIHPETKQVKLIDFSLASLLPKETQEIKNPNVLEGTLAYLSPEQTGRMNRGIDYRADFYAFGVTLFELLTGELPFKSDDAMELVHCHLAKQPPTLEELKNQRENLNIPQVVYNIVLKLMGKNAEDRYQSALGLKYDLENCLRSLVETGNIPDFPIAQRDASDRFLIPEKLYGRETEVQTLLDAFERVSQGDTELMLVAGFSGIGKTAVINEVHKPIVRQRGYFIKGKYDQFQRNIPFSAFVQAFRDLMGQLLSESDAQLAAWKAKIIAAVGENGQVIIDVIPELERIIGQQPPVPELSGSAAQNRFNLLFQKFIQVFTTKEHPLVMFLDDLQWVDSASLNLLQLLMNEASGGYLLILGAYRDNEVFPAHPLILTLEEIEKGQSIVNTITLEPLLEITVNQLVADTLSCTAQLAQPLTQLVYQKTKGNPFFITQFLKALHEDGWIQFQVELGYWQCDMTSVRQLALTDDVVEFMALQLQKLPEKTQEVLKLAACIGNQFDLNTLAIVSEQSEIEAATSLWKALQEGLILPISETYKFFQSREAETTHYDISVPYKFLHDRVQQAAYSLILDTQKPATHYKIGKLLLSSMTQGEREEQIFAIANQLNQSIELVILAKEQQELAELNLLAGKKAKAATAYGAAIDYFSIARRLLTTDCWEGEYELALAVYQENAEAAYLNGDFVQAAQQIEIVLQQARTLPDKIKVYEVQIQSCIAQHQLLEAIKVALQVMQLLGIHFPERPNQSHLQQALEDVRSHLIGRQIESLIDLPVMDNPLKLAAMKILSHIVVATLIVDPALFPLVVCQQVNLSISSGNSSLSASGYANYGLLSCAILADISTGYEFGKLALNLLDRFQAKESKAKTLQIANAFVKHWQEHLAETLNPLLEGYVSGLETGDLEYAAWNLLVHSYFQFILGRELTALEREMSTNRSAIAHIKQDAALTYHEQFHQNVLNLLAQAVDPCRLVGDAYDEEEQLAIHQETNDRTAICILYLNKLMLCYWFGNYTQAVEHATQAEEYLSGLVGLPLIPIFYFYQSLAILTALPMAEPSTQDSWLEKIKVNQEKMQQWAYHAPANCLHRFQLVEAEKYRVLDQKMEAINFYDRAISFAKENGYIQEEALANELAAKFYLAWGKEKVAAVYMQEAYYCYARWGAKAKTDDLETRYPDLLRPILQQEAQTLNPLETLASIASQNISIHTSTKTSRASNNSINTALDFAALIKASQSLSGTIHLDELLHQIAQIVLQNSGGDRCGLIMPNSAGAWQVKAIATPDKTELCSHMLDNNSHLPVKLNQYVKNTREIVVIDDLKTDLPVIDEYLSLQKPKSVLCLPLLDRGNLIGILYLENRSTSGLFTSDRILILNFLCTQAAISLENATLYNTLEQKVAERTQELSQALEYLQSTQKKLVESEKMAALGSLVAGVAHEINTPLGTSITAASILVAKTQTFIEAIATGSMKRSTLTDYAAIAQETGDLIVSNLQRAGDLVHSFKQVAVDQSNLECRTFALKGYIEEVLSALQPKLKQTPHTVTVSGDDDLKITSYPGAIAQIVTNFVTNSILHAYPQGNSGHLKFWVARRDEQIVMQYQDDGCGIPAKHLDKIFDPFFTTARNRGGTGLGLNIVYNLVTQKLSGTIDVQSQVGSGTRFTLLLPKVTTNRS